MGGYSLAFTRPRGTHASPAGPDIRGRLAATSEDAMYPQTWAVDQTRILTRRWDPRPARWVLAGATVAR